MTLIDGEPSDHTMALDRGLAYGDGVFRTMMARDGRVLHWSRHYAKLARDCDRLGIVCPSGELLHQEAERALSGQANAVVKILVTRGVGGRGYAAAENLVPTRVIVTFPASDQSLHRDEDGVHARWCSTRITIQPALAGVKHLNRLDSVLARREWSDPNISEGLMLDSHGRVVEGTMSNVFLLEGRRLVTPVLDEGGVAGVQRERIMAFAGGFGLSASEARIVPARLLAADQVYLVNSVIGMWWVSAIEDRRWGRHSVTSSLIELARREHDDVS